MQPCSLSFWSLISWEGKASYYYPYLIESENKSQVDLEIKLTLRLANISKTSIGLGCLDYQVCVNYTTPNCIIFLALDFKAPFFLRIQTIWCKPFLLLLLLIKRPRMDQDYKNNCLSISSTVNAIELIKPFLVTSIIPFNHWVWTLYPAGTTSLDFTSWGLTKSGFPKARALSHMTSCYLWAYKTYWLEVCWSFILWVKRGPAWRSGWNENKCSALLMPFVLGLMNQFESGPRNSSEGRLARKQVIRGSKQKASQEPFPLGHILQLPN